MSVFYKLRKCTIKNSKSKNKWFAHLAPIGTLSYRDICRHIAEHNSVYGKDVIQGVAYRLQECH